MQQETKTENGITYVKQGDYWIPELEMPEQKEAGRFGRMRLKFIRENRKALYDGLICRCELNSYLSRIDEEAEEIRTKRTQTKLPKIDWMIEQGLVKPGDEICVISHPEETAKVIDGKHVEYKGETMSMNVFGCRVTGWTAIQSYAVMKLVRSPLTVAQGKSSNRVPLAMTSRNPRVRILGNEYFRFSAFDGSSWCRCVADR